MAATFSFVRMSPKQQKGRFRFALLLSAVVCSALYKVYRVGFSSPGELALSVLFDSSVWLFVYALAESVAFRQLPALERLAALFFYPVMYGTFLLVFAHTFFYDVAAERRLSAFDITLARGLQFFETLQARGYIELSLLLLALHGCAWGLSRFLLRPLLLPLWTVTVVCGLASGLLSVRAARVPSALFDSAEDLWELATLPRVEPRPFARIRQRLAELDKSRDLGALIQPSFSKVVVLVAGGMTFAELTRETAPLPDETFLKRERAHLHRYLRYFASNEDTRTGMLSMLTSQLVPFEAYTDAGERAYAHLSHGPSLLDPLEKLGFRSALVASQTGLEQVVEDLPWHERISLRAEDVARERRRRLCFAPEPGADGCEDLAILPAVSAFLRRHERAFVYQELVFGRSYAYNAASGASNAAYYSAYIDALCEQLDAAGIAGQTLVVLTSDHGLRDASERSELAALRLPLLFYAPRFSARSDLRLLSQVDFRDILLEELSQARGYVTPNELVMTVGPTGSGEVSVISEASGLTVLRERGDALFVLTPRTESARALSPAQLWYLFERRRSAFAHP